MYRDFLPTFLEGRGPTTTVDSEVNRREVFNTRFHSGEIGFICHSTVLRLYPKVTTVILKRRIRDALRYIKKKSVIKLIQKVTVIFF